MYKHTCKLTRGSLITKNHSRKNMCICNENKMTTNVTYFQASYIDTPFLQIVQLMWFIKLFPLFNSSLLRLNLESHCMQTIILQLYNYSHIIRLELTNLRRYDHDIYLYGNTLMECACHGKYSRGCFGNYYYTNNTNKKLVQWATACIASAMSAQLFSGFSVWNG